MTLANQMCFHNSWHLLTFAALPVLSLTPQLYYLRTAPSKDPPNPAILNPDSVGYVAALW